MIRIYLFIVCAILANACSKELEVPDVQQPEPEPGSLTINRSSVAFHAQVNVADSFTVEFDGNWSIQVSPEASQWLQVTAPTTTGAAKVYMKALQLNTTASSRTATIIVSADNSTIDRDTILVTQQVYTFSPWQRLYGGTKGDYFDCIISTADTGFIAAGTTHSSDGDVAVNLHETGLWLVRLDVAGNIIWERTYDIPEFIGGSFIVAVSDGYLILGNIGVQWNNMLVGQSHVTKVDRDGNLLWAKPLAVSPGDDIVDIKAATGGGFICAGTGNVAGMNNNGILLRLDDEANVIWQQWYGGIYFDRLAGVAETTDGGFIATGNTDDPLAGTAPSAETVNTYVVRVDASGSLLWEKQYGRPKMDIGEDIITTHDGGYLISAWKVSDDYDSNQGSFDILLTKIDAAGSKEWQKVLASSSDEYPRALLQTASGDFILASDVGISDGDVNQVYGGGDAWVVKLSATGSILWQQTYGGAEWDGARSMVVSNGKLFVAGSSKSSNGEFATSHGDYDAWVVAAELP